MRTIFVGAAVAFLMLGLVQLLVWRTGRFGRWPAFWGSSNLLLGLGSLCAAHRGLAPEWLAVGGANVLTLTGYGMLLAGVRIFAGRPARLLAGALLLAGLIFVLTWYWSGPADFATRVALVSACCGLCDMAIVREAYSMWRRERLLSAWIMVGLFGLTMCMFLLRAWRAASGGFDGADLFSSTAPLDGWLAASSGSLVVLRGMTLLLLAAERSSNRLEALVRRDPLTGALNRAGLRAAAEQMTAHGAPELAVLLVDMDNFKGLNDTYGHAVGDQFLRLFADLARRELRSCDIFARLGGDEFAVLLPAATLQHGVDVAERLRSHYRDAAAQFDPQGIGASLSIGAAHGRLGAHGAGLDGLLKLADDALYDAKRGGRDRVAALVVHEVASARVPELDDTTDISDAAWPQNGRQ